ncbi:MAG: sigma-70 family RNA polymerase sigma factor, partial [Solirubrobacterales bacterium]
MTPHISTTLLRTQTDERLVRLAAGGHERAFEAIVERYRRPLTRFAQRYVGEARAEEVVQTAFLNAWNSLRSGTDVHDLKPWLYRIVNNGAINALQRAEYSDAPLIEASDFRMGPEAAFEQSEELRLTVENIAGLPERQREALLAVAVDGRAHADVARDLGVSDAGVRQLVRRARVQLRAAATAITPIPLAVWIAKGGLASGATAAGGSAAAGSATAGGSAAAGTAAGGAAMGGALKMGAVVAGVATVAAGGSEVAKKVEERNSNSAPPVTMASAAPGERTLIPGADPAMALGSGQARVRIVTGPDGVQRAVMQVPGAGAPVPVSMPGAGAPTPAPVLPGYGGPGDTPRQVADLFIPSMPAPAPTPAPGRTAPQAPSGPQQVADFPARPQPGSGGNPGTGGSRPALTPERPATTPTRPAPTPERPANTPTRPAPTPERPTFTPTRPAPAPERPTFTPTRPTPAPERPSAPS